MSAFETIVFEKADGIAWITLNRPEVLNAINLRMRDELWEAVQAVSDDPGIGVVIFKGAGQEAFSTGADIKDFGMAPSYVEARRARQQRDLWGYLWGMKKPTLAAIQGYALGAGLELALLCDFRIASADARLGLPEVNLGYIPAAGGTQTLPRTVRPGVALPMILTGDPVDAHEALRLGLVQKVVPWARLYEEVEGLARLPIQPRRAEAVRQAKRAIRQGLDLPLAQGLALEWRLARQLLGGASPSS